MDVVNLKEKLCKSCGRVLEGKRKKVFCNVHCQMNYYYHQWIIKWKNGEETGIVGEYGISKHLRRYLFEKYENKCSKCGWSEVNPYTGKIPLEVEHIDGDYTNNDENNLTLLCPNCHSLTATYKGANAGNGRQTRRKYYN